MQLAHVSATLSCLPPAQTVSQNMAIRGRCIVMLLDYRLQHQELGHGKDPGQPPAESRQAHQVTYLKLSIGPNLPTGYLQTRHTYQKKINSILHHISLPSPLKKQPPSMATLQTVFSEPSFPLPPSVSVNFCPLFYLGGILFTILAFSFHPTIDPHSGAPIGLGAIPCLDTTH